MENDGFEWGEEEAKRENIITRKKNYFQLQFYYYYSVLSLFSSAERLHYIFIQFHLNYNRNHRKLFHSQPYSSSSSFTTHFS